MPPGCSSFCAAASFRPAAADNKPLERGAAMTDPALLRELDHARCAHDLADAVARAEPQIFHCPTVILFGWLPQLAPVRAGARCASSNAMSRGTRRALPNESIGVGEGFDVQLFDRAAVRMPAMFASCWPASSTGWTAPMSRRGELRRGPPDLPARPAPQPLIRTAATTVSQRLPMTLNLVLKARDDRELERTGKQISCAEIARRWLANGSAPPTRRN